MWIKNKFGASCNMDQVFGLTTGTNGDEGGYEVQATNNQNTLIAQFLTTPGISMTETEAVALLNRMEELLGVTDLAQ